MNKQTRKTGSGRTKGAVSSLVVTLNQLNRKLKPSQKVVINRRFAEMYALKGKPMVASYENYRELAA